MSIPSISKSGALTVAGTSFDIPRTERDRVVLSAGSWPDEAAEHLGAPWTAKDGHMLRHLRVYDEGSTAKPHRLWEALLRFPNAPVYATHQLRKLPFEFSEEQGWPNYHTMR